MGSIALPCKRVRKKYYFNVNVTLLRLRGLRDSSAILAYSKRVPRTNCALRIKKCATRISSGIYFLSTS